LLCPEQTVIEKQYDRHYFQEIQFNAQLFMKSVEHSVNVEQKISA